MNLNENYGLGQKEINKNNNKNLETLKKSYSLLHASLTPIKLVNLPNWPSCTFCERYGPEVLAPCAQKWPLLPAQYCRLPWPLQPEGLSLSKSVEEASLQMLHVRLWAIF